MSQSCLCGKMYQNESKVVGIGVVMDCLIIWNFKHVCLC